MCSAARANLNLEHSPHDRTIAGGIRNAVSKLENEVRCASAAAKQTEALLNLSFTNPTVVLHIHSALEHPGFTRPAYTLTAGRRYRDAVLPGSSQHGFRRAHGERPGRAGKPDREHLSNRTVLFLHRLRRHSRRESEAFLMVTVRVVTAFVEQFFYCGHVAGRAAGEEFPLLEVGQPFRKPLQAKPTCRASPVAFVTDAFAYEEQLQSRRQLRQPLQFRAKNDIGRRPRALHKCDIPVKPEVDARPGHRHQWRHSRTG